MVTNASLLSFVATASLLTALVRGLRLRQVTAPGLHTEGPVWFTDKGGLLFVDIAAERLHFYNPATGQVHGVTLGGPVTPVMVQPDGALVVGVGRTLQWMDWAASNFSSTPPSRPTVIAAVEDGKPGNRFNDGNIDNRGRMWVGTMGPEPVVGHVEPDQAAVYRITPQSGDIGPLWPLWPLPLRPYLGAAEVVTVLAPVSISNGLVWDRDQTLMYYIDTPTRRVDVFDFDSVQGTIANRRPAFDFAVNGVDGNPDGMTIDADGNLWVACFGGSQVIQVDPREGRLLRRIAIPATQVTAVALGGPRDRHDGDTLYVTSMRKGLSEEQLAQQPAAGALFAVTGLGVRAQRSTMPLPPRTQHSR